MLAFRFRHGADARRPDRPAKPRRLGLRRAQARQLPPPSGLPLGGQRHRRCRRACSPRQGAWMLRERTAGASEKLAVRKSQT